MAQKDMTKNQDASRDQIVQELKRSYNMELETVINYLANSVHLDGVRAEEIRKALAADVTDELGHAQRLAKRLKVLDSDIPGSQELKWEQTSLQPPRDMTDVVLVIRGVIDAEEGAIEQYRKLIDICDGVDWVTQEMCIELLGDEEEHKRLFRGYLTEYEHQEVRQRQVA
jgi:bacterioferritin